MAPDWKEILGNAAMRVQGVVQRVREKGEQSIAVRKGASGDTTLVADEAAEKEIFKALTNVKGLRIISEEAGETGDQSGDWTAVIDPLDGSSNFKRGIPFYCTSIAVVEGAQLSGLRAAVVRNLVTGDVYYSESGKGTTKNGIKIQSSKVMMLKDSVAGVDLSQGGEGVIEKVTPLLSKVRRHVHMGANALELCLLAEGGIDIFVDIRDRMRIVDFAGAYLIAKESGAIVTTPSNGKVEPEVSLKSRFSYVASANRSLHRVVLSELAGPR